MDATTGFVTAKMREPAPKANRAKQSSSHAESNDRKDFQAVLKDSVDKTRQEKKAESSKDKGKDSKAEALKGDKLDEKKDEKQQVKTESASSNEDAQKPAPVLNESLANVQQSGDQQKLLNLQQLLQTVVGVQTEDQEKIPIKGQQAIPPQVGTATDGANKVASLIPSQVGEKQVAPQILAGVFANEVTSQLKPTASKETQGVEGSQKTHLTEQGKAKDANVQPSLMKTEKGMKAAQNTVQNSQQTNGHSKAETKVATANGKQPEEHQGIVKRTGESNGSAKKIEGEIKPLSDVPLESKAQSFDLSKVNIKVAENNINAEKVNVPDQIAEKITYNLKNGKQEFDIQLQPKELGKINVKIILENGTAQVLLNCANPKTQHLVMMNSDAIKSIVEANTNMNTTVNVQNEHKGAEQYQQRDQTQEQDHQRHQEEQQRQARRDQYSKEETLSFLNQLKFGLLDEEVS